MACSDRGRRLLVLQALDTDAGLQAGWLNRRTTTYPGFFEAPDATGKTLVALADALLADR